MQVASQPYIGAVLPSEGGWRLRRNACTHHPGMSLSPMHLHLDGREFSTVIDNQ